LIYSYTTFNYSNLYISKKSLKDSEKNKIVVSVDIQNSGEMKGDEVVQLYIKDLESSVIQPLKKLRKFKRVTLDKGDITTVAFTLCNEDFSYWDEDKKDWTIESGEFELLIGSSSEDIRLKGSVVYSN